MRISGRCTICFDPRRGEIDRALVAGTPYRSISSRFGTSLGALNWHKAHIATAIAKVQEKREERSGENSLDEMCRVQQKAWELLAKCEADGDNRASIVALREVRECIESLGEMLTKAAKSEDRIHVTVEVLGQNHKVCPYCEADLTKPVPRELLPPELLEAIKRDPEDSEPRPFPRELLAEKPPDLFRADQKPSADSGVQSGDKPSEPVRKVLADYTFPRSRR